MKKKKTPDIIDVNTAQLEEIKSRLTSGIILEEDKPVILAIISAYTWIQVQLQSAKLNIYRLKSLFGFRTEKRKKSDENRKNTNLKLDLNSLGTMSYKDGLSSTPDSIIEDPTIKK
jgi:hypothetical protein